MAYTYTPTVYSDPKKRENELAHNQPKPPVYPQQTQPDQIIPITQPTQNVFQPQMAAAPQEQGQPQQTAAPEYKAPTFSPEQAAALAYVPPPPVDPNKIQGVPSGYTPEQMYQNLLNAGYGKVTAGFQSPTTDIASQLTQQLMQDPNMGIDYNKLNQQRLAQFDFDQAQAFEKARQGMAPVSESGEMQELLRDFAFQQGRERSQFGVELEDKANQEKFQRLMDVLTAGREMSETERKRFETEIGSLTGMIGAGEGTEQRRYDAAENAINRGMELAINSNNQAFQLALTELQGKLDQGIELTKMDFQAAQNELDRELKKAMQSDDINARREALMTQLQFDQTMQEMGFEFTSEENALNRALQLSLQTGDQAFQEKMLGLKEKMQLNLMTTEQEWQGIQNDLNRQIESEIAKGNWNNAMELQKMKQEFENVQNEKQMQHETEMQKMTFEHDKWKQDRVDSLTQMGWDHETAMQQAEHENQLYMQDFEWKKKELMQQGVEEHEAEMLAQQYGYQMQMQSLDHQLQREIEAGRIDIEDRKLLQDSSQFKSKQDFDEWALRQGIKESRRDRIWRSNEAIFDRRHDMQMAQLQQEMAQKGLNYSLLMSQIENMPAEQAAELVNQAAIDAGMTYQDENGITQQGLKPILPGEEGKDQMIIDIENKLSENVLLTPNEYEYYKYNNSFERIPYENTSKKINIEMGLRKLVNHNTGEVFRAQNGELYRIEGGVGPAKKFSVIIRSLGTGKEFNWNGYDKLED